MQNRWQDFSLGLSAGLADPAEQTPPAQIRAELGESSSWNWALVAACHSCVLRSLGTGTCSHCRLCFSTSAQPGSRKPEAGSQRATHVTCSSVSVCQPGPTGGRPPLTSASPAFPAAPAGSALPQRAGCTLALGSHAELCDL